MTSFDSADPDNTSLFSTSMTLFDAMGREGTLVLYFSREANSWSYHAFLGNQTGAGLEVGSGELEFEGGSLSHWRVNQPLRLPAPDGRLGPEIELRLGTPLDAGGTGLDGVRSFDEPNTVWTQRVDGDSARVGKACARTVAPRADDFGSADPEISQGDEVVTGPVPSCAAQASARLAIRANLWAQAPLAAAWDPLDAEETSNLRTRLWITDASGRIAEVDLCFAKTELGKWAYHVLLVGDVPGLELGSGQLEFNANGSLRRVLTRKALFFPNPKGEASQQIDLDFGEPTESGASGMDGVTSFGTGSWLLSVKTDGLRGMIGRECAESPSEVGAWFVVAGDPTAVPDWSRPPCTGKFSSELSVSGCLAPTVPLVTSAWSIDDPEATSSLSASSEIEDSSARPIPVTLYYRHLSALSWEYRLLLGDPGKTREVASGQLIFGADGMLQRSEGTSEFRLAASDGSPGPLIRLNFGLPSVPSQWTFLVSRLDFPVGAYLYSDGRLAEATSRCTDD